MIDNENANPPTLHCWICGRFTDYLLRFRGPDGSVTYAHEKCWKEKT